MPEFFTDTPLLTERFDAALHYAIAHHAQQLRKGTPIPYAAHLLAVASLVLEMHGDEDEAIGGLLHDVVEDGGGPEALAYIEEHFGANVADIVLANSDSVTGEEEKAPWHERKRAYIAAFSHKSPAALRVSLADKLHNARSILTDYRAHGDALWARFGQGKGWRRASTTASSPRRSSARRRGWASTRRPRSTSCAASSMRSRRSPRSARGRTRA